jgi:deoxyribodipyrimidine photo-lyase
MLEAVPEFRAEVQRRGEGYFFYLRARRSDPNDVLYRLAAAAHTVVTDDYPVFIADRNNRLVASHLRLPFVAVDSSCIVPMSIHEKQAWAAYTIRPKIHRELPRFLKPPASLAPMHKWRDDLLPEGVSVLRTDVPVDGVAALVARCEINQSIAPSTCFGGGAKEARQRLDLFLEGNLRRYAKESNQPSAHATSNLSPHLHFGHISSLEIALAVQSRAEQHKLMAGEFLEQLIVRRELSFNFARFTDDPESLDSTPEWAKRTMAKHAADSRPFLYSPEQFERAETHDELWNAAQKELLLRGIIHGYYRMYWAKKIIEWTPTYEDALRLMIDLHNVYALDGRDPNTYTNILWCFGLHDRPWGERPVFGQLRYMSQEGMKRKTDTATYIKEIALLEATGKDPYRL